MHSSFLNPGGTLDPSQEASYVVRIMKPLECFGDVGLLLTNQQRTASVVATEKTLLMKIDRETFLEMRASNSSREIRWWRWQLYNRAVTWPLLTASRCMV